MHRRGNSFLNISFTFGKNLFILRKYPSKLHKDLVLTKSRTLFELIKCSSSVRWEKVYYITVTNRNDWNNGLENVVKQLGWSSCIDILIDLLEHWQQSSMVFLHQHELFNLSAVGPKGSCTEWHFTSWVRCTRFFQDIKILSGFDGVFLKVKCFS